MLLRSGSEVGASRLKLLSFIKFGGLSGLGWLLDFTILLLLVGAAGLPAAAANVASSATAALTVFLVSRHLVFARSHGALGIRIVVYAGYTLCLILVMSVVMHYLIALFRTVAGARGIPLTASVAAALAKIVVTPPQLLMNFLMSQHVSERPIARGTTT